MTHEDIIEDHNKRGKPATYDLTRKQRTTIEILIELHKMIGTEEIEIKPYPTPYKHDDLITIMETILRQGWMNLGDRLCVTAIRNFYYAELKDFLTTYREERGKSYYD